MLITGGSSGIGRAAAAAFARSGAHVVIAARGEARGYATVDAIAEAGGTAAFIPADVADADAIAALFTQIADRYGRLDASVHNAASGEGAFQRTADFEADEFDRVMATNLKGVWLCMKHAIRQMLQQDPPGGAIVNVSSINGLGGAPQGICVNALVPGSVQTPMLETVFDRASGGDAEQRAAVEAQYQEMTAVGRIGAPDEAAQAILWLCADASSYVVGHSLIVDGGATAAVR